MQLQRFAKSCANCEIGQSIYNLVSSATSLTKTEIANYTIVVHAKTLTWLKQSPLFQYRLFGLFHCYTELFVDFTFFSLSCWCIIRSVSDN